MSPTPHLDVLRTHWTDITAFESGARVPLLDGHTLSLATVLAVARFNVVPQLDQNSHVVGRVRASAEFTNTLVTGFRDGKCSMYGVNTGFGGSCKHTRVKEVRALQEVLITNLQVGVIPPPSHWQPEVHNKSPQNFPTLSFESLLMPEPWTKGAIAIRMNSLIRGHSGCRLELIHALHALLVANITPSPPLRMTISASGDLGPLAYIAAAVTGDRKCLVWSGEGAARTRIPASQALAQHRLKALQLQPKEGLSIINGTAPSCSTAASALHDAHFVFMLSQACTAMCVEALEGTQESFSSFLHDVARPHPGQVEVACNMRHALKGSKLARDYDELDPTQRLRQDRYSLRTAPQWIGPQIEEALAAHRTLEKEINATTDNPIIDASPNGAGPINGGNFQGTSLTVAMEKVRIGLQHVGRIAYAQFVELGHPSMNRGLAPDLAAGEPSLDFGQKSLDVASASYLAELSFVSNTLSNHVQPAEMHNQSVNSLALISARYTATAVQLTQMILANQLVSLCQAVELRAMYRLFFEELRIIIRQALTIHITPPLPSPEQDKLTAEIFGQARVSFSETSTLDTDDRFPALVKPLLAEVFTFLSRSSLASVHKFDAPGFHTALAHSAASSWLANRTAYFEGKKGDARMLLGRTVELYRWVRDNLRVPMRTGTERDEEERIDVQVSRVYEGVVKGDVNGILLKVLGGDGPSPFVGLHAKL